MLLGNEKVDQVNYVRQLTEAFLEAALEMDIILACNIIALDDARKELGT